VNYRPLCSGLTKAHWVLRPSEVLEEGDDFLRNEGQWCRTPFLQFAKCGMVKNTCCKAQRMGASVASHIRLPFLHAGVGRG
jgi:hypothetical protein